MAWSKMIEIEGEVVELPNGAQVRTESRTVRLFERTWDGGSRVYYSYRNLAGKKVRESTKKSDHDEAEVYVRAAFARAFDEIKKDDFDPSKSVTLGQVFRLYFEHEVPLHVPKWNRTSHTRRELLERAWGRDMAVRDISQADVNHYAHRRRTGALRPPKSRVEHVRDGTIGGELQWASVVFRWAMGFRVDGRPLLDSNPLAVLKRPKTKPTDMRRPKADQDRYVRTMQHVDTVDPTGRLGTMLTLARYTGRRENAICQLRVSDFLRTVEDVRTALGGLGLDEGHAGHFPNGGIRWRAEYDKMRHNHVTPLNRDARAALDAYLRQNPRLGEAPMFPSPRDQSSTLGTALAGRWLMRAEALAELPPLNHGRWHPYRRLWATERRHLPVQDVAAAGGWTNTQALVEMYQQAEPAKILEVIEVG